MPRKTPLIILFLLVAFVVSVSAQIPVNDTSGNARKYTLTDSVAARALQIGYGLPQERVYLHFDNSSYYLGETIWFKAFVTSHGDDAPTILSRVLYVELMSPEGYVVKTEKYRIGDDGTCCGDIYMDPLYLSGYYEVRAYTRYMLNWGDETIFRRVFPVFDAVNAGDWGFRNMRDRDKGYFANKVFKKDIEPDLKFYPESGHLVNGIESKVAYELTGYEGVDIYDRITVYVNGDSLLTTVPVHMGKGKFVITPQPGSEYKAKVAVKNKDGKYKNFSFSFPKIEEEGVVISMEEGDSCFDFHIGNGYEVNTELAFSILHRNKLGFFHRIGCNDTLFSVAKNDLPEGVCRAIVFSGRTPLAERLFFVQHDSLVAGDREIVKLKVTGNGYQLHNLEVKPHEKINITVEREDGKPLDVTSDFLFSVTDHAGKLVTSWGHDMYTYLLLGSELKGYIPDARQYFDTLNAGRKEHLDLVMLTNGWTAYDWEKLTAESLAGVLQPEEGVTIGGEFVLRVKNLKMGELGSSRSIKQPYNVVRLDFTDSSKVIKAQAFRTDAAGKFNFILDDFYGKQTVALSPNTIFKHSSRLKYVFYLDKYFSPPPLQLHYWQKRAGSSIREAADTLSGMKRLGFNEYFLESVDVTANRSKDYTRTAPISELRLDYLDEWEYAMDVTYRDGLYLITQKNEVLGDYYIEDLPKETSTGGNYFDRAERDGMGGISAGDMTPFDERISYMRETNDDYSLVPTAEMIMHSIAVRYNLGWQNWVYFVVPKGGYDKDSIPEIDHKYLHGVDVEAMTNFKEVVLSTDSKKLESVKGGSKGYWEAKYSACSFKNPYNRFYKGFLTQASIQYQMPEGRIYSSEDYKMLDRMSRRMDISTEYTLSARRRMKHPNMIAYFIPDDRDNRTFIKNDLSVTSSTRRYTAVQGYSQSKQFYSPDYSRVSPQGTDFRRTLLWSPAVRPVDGKLQVELYSSSVCNAIDVDVLGYHENIIYSNAYGVETKVDTTGNRKREIRKRRETTYDIRKDSLLMAQCDAEFKNAEVYHNKRNYRKALNSYIELVGYQYPAAFYRIGEYYQKGINLKQRFDLAAEFYERGAELGVPRCYYELSGMYARGEHYPRNREKEMEMLELAAELAVPEAQNQLGEYLLQGKKIEKDTVRAVEYFYEAAKQEHPNAMFHYAEHMLRTGVENDSLLGSVADCMQFAADRGDHSAMIWIVMNEESKGNYRKAYLMAKQLYLEGSADGAAYMAECYLLGRGVKRDKRLAKDLYRDAANGGNEKAKEKLKEL